ncbi:uncharacterized protein LOC126885038 [Diabrotica virgifera virgifera]|uniref:Retrovirus-related Pol polyprotein from transposon n=1 Tax=Diabrotica virgifera virgifera TaxID=50390 RepID=A0ABM5KB60_DIAVI|nr:uncharacterized protein LOC126885038 [Diabrotica virgifera virgifera]
MRQYNVGSPMERVAIDIAGPFPETDAGNKYILVAMDYFTKWTEAYALPNQEAATVAEVLVKELFSRFGVPLEIHSDQGRNFESALFQNVCKFIGVNKTRTTPLHPQSDGMVERMNRTMGKHLSKVVSENQRDWDQHIHLFLMAYRSAVNETTGQTPTCLMLGREVRLPCDLEFGCRPSEEHVAGEEYVDRLKLRMNNIHEFARQHIQIASDRMKDQYDSRCKNESFEIGDLVWLYNPQRRRGLCPNLQRQWEGPYEVKKKINDVIYRIKKLPNGKPKVIHINRLAPYAGSNETEEARVLQQEMKDAPQPSFKEFMSNYAERKSARFGVTTEVQQDLFGVPENVSLAHCVAQDLEMTKGISSVFNRKFGRLDELRNQHPKIGRVLRLEGGPRSLLYMVTRKSYTDTPSYENIWRALTNLKKIVCNYDIKDLALPKIGHAVENLDWKIVRSMLEVIFRETGVRITVCCMNPKMSYPSKTVDCYFFSMGVCRAGESCRFRHPGPSSRVADRDAQILRGEQCNKREILADRRITVNTSRMT